MLSNASRIARMGTVKGSSGVYKRAFGWSCPSLSYHPNPPIHLDPSMQDLLKDVDMALSNHKLAPYQTHRELKALPVEQDQSEEALDLVENTLNLDRKSPAALFGSEKIGQVVIPQHLQEAIRDIIEDTDKSQLHADAKRLFADFTEEGETSGWQVELDTKYRSRKQGERHAERDAMAFASVVMPAHYSAISAVFGHLRHRLGSSWEVDRVVDWGAGTGTGLWASLFSFQEDHRVYGSDTTGLEASNSTLRSYIAIDKREGLVAIARRIYDRIATPKDLSIQYQKTFREEDQISRESGKKTLALSAFALSSLPTPLARKAMVKQMWESGANTLVLIDHNTKDGFEVIAQAREYLLRQGRKEVEKSEPDLSPRGSYVIAPCPHDGFCPVFNAGSKRLVCGFTQRLQRPEFVRLTKHSGIGHEDVGYSYVVIQRGSRPDRIDSHAGRVGLVGKWAEEAKAKRVLKELELFDKHESIEPTSPEVTSSRELSVVEGNSFMYHSELQDALRREAYHWPRLVFPPMKKNGHVILDSCTSEGKIMRMTIPKSQGKQPYYDARKSAWGDLFPHPPKNPPQERVVLRDVEGNALSIERDHIGKNRHLKPVEKEHIRKYSDYLATTIRETKKANRRWERNVKATTIWNKDD